MINTDNYEGITEGDNEIGWRIVGDNFVMNDKSPTRFIAYVQVNNDGEHTIVGFSDADANLIADAPLLLAEVKRLYGEPRMTIDEWNTKPEGPCVTVYMNGCEYVGCLRLYKNEDGEVIE
jgi:hypothetical protein